MFRTTKGSIYEIWDEADFDSLEEAIWQAEFWTAEYPEQEIVVYDSDAQPIKAWIAGQITYDKEAL